MTEEHGSLSMSAHEFRSESNQILIDSVLFKKSPSAVFGRHPWQKRRFRLYRDRLEYSNVKKHSTLGVISMSDIVTVNMSPSKSSGCRFDITLPQRTFSLTCSSKAECATWVLTLQKTLREWKAAGLSNLQVRSGKFWKIDKKSKVEDNLSMVEDALSSKYSTHNTMPAASMSSQSSQPMAFGSLNGVGPLTRTGTSTSDFVASDTFDEKEDETDYMVGDYILEDQIAEGPFGSICVVQHGDTHETALMQIIENDSEHAAEGSRILNLLGRFEWTYLMYQHSRGETESCIWAVYSYPLAGELFSYLRRVRRFPISIAQLYVAEVLETTAYLHSIGLVFTNLGPEQIFLDRDGHIHISDFLLGNKSEYTGTPEYTPPEFLQDGVNDVLSDWWRLGILLYELTVGVPPFRSNDGNEEELYRKITDVSYAISFPPFLPQPAKDLITQLLNRTPEQRLGANNPEDIRAHPFFEGIDWSGLRSRSVPAPSLIRQQIQRREQMSSDEED
eukprot:453686_1